MKTNLNRSIKTKKQAEEYLAELHRNGEDYHLEDPADTIIWNGEKPSEEEMKKLDILMDQIYQIKGFDPCEYLLSLPLSNQIQTWESLAGELLIGKKVELVRYMTVFEARELGIDSRPLILQLEGGVILYPMSDNEGNDGGALHTNSEPNGFPVIQ